MAHNGGITQLNLGSLQTGGDFPFLDLFLNGQYWIRSDNSTQWDMTKHDANGYLTTVYGTGVYKVFFVPSQVERPGNYVVKWVGNGTVTRGMSSTTVSGSLSGLNGRCEFSTSATSFSIGVSALGSPPISKIMVCHVDDEAALDAAILAGRPWEWGVKFLQRLNEAKPGVLRFLNPCDGNLTPLSHWADRKPTTYYDYGAAPYMKSTLYAGVTSNSGDDYTIAFSGFTLTDKARVLVKFNATSTGGSPRIDVEGTGLKYMKDQYINEDGGNVIPYVVRYPLINKLCFLTYDLDLDCYIMNGGSTESSNGGTTRGWPYEIMIDLCNQIGAHCSIPLPKLALDPMTDFVQSLCEYGAANLASGLKLQLQDPNETWNTAGGFTNTIYAQQKQKLRNGGGSFDEDQWCGRVLSTIGQTMSAVFGADRTKYDCICGVWTFGSTSSQNDRLASSHYVAETGNASDAAKYWVTQVHCTGYWKGSKQNASATEIAAASAYAAASTDAERAAIVDTFMLDDSGTAVARISEVFLRYAAWRSWIDGFGQSIALGQYEGGFSPDYNSTTEVNTFRAATKNWPTQYQRTFYNYDTFINTYGGIFPSCFQMAGTANAWSVLDPDIYVVAAPPQWKAIVDYNNGIRRFQATTS